MKKIFEVNTKDMLYISVVRKKQHEPESRLQTKYQDPKENPIPNSICVVNRERSIKL